MNGFWILWGAGINGAAGGLRLGLVGLVGWVGLVGLVGLVGIVGLVGALRLRRRSRVAERGRVLFGTDTCGFGARLRRRLARLRVGRPTWLVPELLLVPVGIALAQSVRSPVPLVGALVGVVPLRGWRRRRRLAAEARRRASAVIELCEGLAAEMRSGATPAHALHTVTVRASSLRSGLGADAVARLAAGHYGGDIPAALRYLAELPGGRGAAAVAACWRVATDSGGGLAGGLDQLADALRAERALSEEIEGELAAPRTTIAVLAALPLVGLLLGAALGAKPVRVLLHTPAGLGSLAAGALLEVAGLVWTARIIRSAAEPPSGGGTAECGLSRRKHGAAEVAR